MKSGGFVSRYLFENSGNKQGLKNNCGYVFLLPKNIIIFPVNQNALEKHTNDKTEHDYVFL